MASITISNLTWSATPGVNQIVDVRYRLTSDPDVIGSYITVATNLSVPASGTLTSPLVIGSLLNNTSYTVWVQNTCAGAGYKKAFITPLPTCVEITDITGTVAP